MGLFSKTEICPECRTKGAVKTFLSQVKCPNPLCKHYDSSAVLAPSEVSHEKPQPRTSQAGVFDPGANRLTIQYRNFRGQDRQFEADRSTVRFKKRHISVCVAPTYKRIALAKKFIKNLSDMESLAVRIPTTGVERQILGYHKKYGTTSPRFEELLRKYPLLK